MFETAARIGSTFRDTKGNDSKHFSQFNRRVYTSFIRLMNTPRIHLTMDPYYVTSVSVTDIINADTLRITSVL